MSPPELILDILALGPLSMRQLQACLKAFNASWHLDPWIDTLEIEGKIVVERQRRDVIVRLPSPTKAQKCKRRVDAIKAV